MRNRFIHNSINRCSSLLFKCSSSTPLAVIVEGNPVYNNEHREGFYEDVQQVLEESGFEVKRDPGLPYTTPPKADLWVGHSRGADRLRFAPKDTRVLAIGSNRTDIPVINHRRDPIPDKPGILMTDEERQAHIKHKDIRYHFKLTPKMKKQLQTKAASVLQARAVVLDMMKGKSYKEIEAKHGVPVMAQKLMRLRARRNGVAIEDMQRFYRSHPTAARVGLELGTAGAILKRHPVTAAGALGSFGYYLGKRRGRSER